MLKTVHHEHQKSSSQADCEFLSLQGVGAAVGAVGVDVGGLVDGAAVGVGLGNDVGNTVDADGH